MYQRSQGRPPYTAAMDRRSRFVAALAALLALLFCQLAVAAYACPQIRQAPKAETVCDHDTSQTPNLCIEHCAYGDVSLGSAKPAPPAPDLVAIGIAPSPVAVLPPAARVALRMPASATPPPPLLARFTVLRI